MGETSLLEHGLQAKSYRYLMMTFLIPGVSHFPPRISISLISLTWESNCHSSLENSRTDWIDRNMDELFRGKGVKIVQRGRKIDTHFSYTIHSDSHSVSNHRQSGAHFHLFLTKEVYSHRVVYHRPSSRWRKEKEIQQRRHDRHAEGRHLWNNWNCQVLERKRQYPSDTTTEEER